MNKLRIFICCFLVIFIFTKIDCKNNNDVIQDLEIKMSNTNERINQLSKQIDRLLVNKNNQTKSNYSELPSKKIKQEKTKHKGIYKLPAWPFCSTFHYKQELFNLDFYFDHSSRAYSHSWGTKNLSNLVFGKDKIYLKDILLVSDLLNKKLVKPNPLTTPYAKSYLYLLADQKLNFKARQDKQTLDFNYSKHFLKDKITAGIQIPVVRRANKLRFSSPLTSSMKESLISTDPKFFNKYEDMKDFFEDICDQKDINYTHKKTAIGLGDISLFANYDIPIKSHHLEKMLVGLNLLLPTSKQKNIYTLWDSELGNGGFTQISLFNGTLLSFNNYFNPHFFLKLSAGFSANVYERVPQKLSYNGFDPEPNKDLGDVAIFGNDVLYMDAFQNQLDSKVLNLSDEGHKISIRPGPELYLRLGNVFEKFIMKKMFLDIFYDFRAKGRDYLSSHSTSYLWNGSILTQKTDQAEHSIGFSLSYQFDSTYRLKTGLGYVFAGRNVPENIDFNLSLNVEF